MKKIGRFLKTFFLVDILRGLAVTLRYYFGRKITIQYPEQVQPVPERFKGILRLHKDADAKPASGRVGRTASISRASAIRRRASCGR